MSNKMYGTMIVSAYGLRDYKAVTKLCAAAMEDGFDLNSVRVTVPRGKAHLGAAVLQTGFSRYELHKNFSINSAEEDLMELLLRAAGVDLNLHSIFLDAVSSPPIPATYRPFAHLFLEALCHVWQPHPPPDQHLFGHPSEYSADALFCKQARCWRWRCMLESKTHGIDWAVKDGRGNTILHMAIGRLKEYDLYSIFPWLMGLGIDPGATNKKGQTTAEMAWLRFTGKLPVADRYVIKVGCGASNNQILEAPKNKDFFNRIIAELEMSALAAATAKAMPTVRSRRL